MIFPPSLTFVASSHPHLSAFGFHIPLLLPTPPFLLHLQCRASLPPPPLPLDPPPDLSNHYCIFWDTYIHTPNTTNFVFHLHDNCLTSSNILHNLALSLHSGSLYLYLFLIGKPSFPLSFLLTPFFSSSSSSNFIHETFDATLIKAHAASVKPIVGLPYLYLFLTSEPFFPLPFLLIPFFSSSFPSNFVHGTFDATLTKTCAASIEPTFALLKGCQKILLNSFQTIYMR